MSKTFELGPGADFRELLNYLTENDHRPMDVTVAFTDTRTAKQNKAIHKYCAMLAKDLNDCGYEQVKALKLLRGSDEIEIPWRKESVKEDLWRVVQMYLTKVKSTSDLTPKQVSEVYLVLSRKLAESVGVSTPFPDRFGQ